MRSEGGDRVPAVAKFAAAGEGKSDQIMLAQKMLPRRWEGVVFQRP
jgi:hypothetical protein